MFLQTIAFLLIAFQLDVIWCRPQSQYFNGSNPFYESYISGGNYRFNNSNLNPYATQKPLYPTLHPQIPTTTPQPYFVKGQHNPTPYRNYFNRNSSFHNPSNSFGNYNNSFGWNSNFNPQTTPQPSSYQPYGQTVATTRKPPATTLPPFYPTGSYNLLNRTSAYSGNRTNPTYPSYRPQPAFSNVNPQPTIPNTQPQFPQTFNNNGQRNFTNNYNNTFTNRAWNRNSTSPTPSQHRHSSQNYTQGVKNNFNGNNNYNPQYRPSAPIDTNQGTGFSTNPHYYQGGTPLATYTTFHANMPANDHLFNYDNLHRRRPNNGYESSPYEQSNVPLAPFPGSKSPTYDSISNVPLAPFPGRR